jgi:hypothetical protein
MSEDAKVEKVGESAYFVVDFGNYCGTVVSYNPTLARQTVVYSPSLAEVIEAEPRDVPLEAGTEAEEESE